MTIVIAFHLSHYRDFKAFYHIEVLGHWRAAFPGAVSYSRFVDFIPSALAPLCAYLRQCFGTCSGLTFVDVTTLAVCHNRRIARHRVFAGLAARGETSLGWFFGFKRVIIEFIIDQLKNISQIEHSRHRSVTNFFVNLLGGLIAYCH